MGKSKEIRKNPLIRGWSSIKRWWSIGIKGKMVVILCTIVCIVFTQSIYITTGIGMTAKSNDDEYELSNEEKVQLTYEEKEYITLDIEGIYSNLETKVLDINVVSINFESVDILVNKGKVSGNIYELNDSGKVLVEYKDGSKVEKDYLLTYKINTDIYDIESKLIIDGVIDTTKDHNEIYKIQDEQRIKENIKEQELLMQNNDKYEDSSINEYIVNEDAVIDNIVVDKYLYQNDIELIVEQLVNEELTKLENYKKISSVEFESDGNSYTGNGYMNGNTFELDSNFYFNYLWSDESIQNLSRQAGFSVKLEYDVKNKIVINSNINLNGEFN